MGLVDELRARKKKSAREYVELIRRADSPKPGDAERLAGIVATLGVSEEQLKQDVAEIKEASSRAAELQARAAKKADSTRALVLAQREEKATMARIHEMRQEADTLGMVAHEAVQVARNALTQAEGAEHALANLRQDHPRLFPDVEPAAE